MRPSILTRDFLTVPAFRVLARIIGVWMLAMFFKKAVMGLMSGTTTFQGWQYHGIEAYLCCVLYLICGAGLSWIVFTPTRHWRRRMFFWPLRIYFVLILTYAVAIAIRTIVIRVSAH
jgi:hypothetical protein